MDSAANISDLNRKCILANSYTLKLVVFGNRSHGQIILKATGLRLRIRRISQRLAKIVETAPVSNFGQFGTDTDTLAGN